MSDRSMSPHTPLPPRRPPNPGPGPIHIQGSLFQVPAPSDPGQAVEVQLQRDPLPHSDSENQTTFDKDWTKIKNLRVEVWSLRSKIYELRHALRDKQLVKSLADDRLIEYVRKRGLGVAYGYQDTAKEHKTLTELLQACEVARNDYGPLEDDCNQLENHLGTKEFQLQNLEDAFYERPVIPRLEPSPLERVQISAQSSYTSHHSARASISSMNSGSEISQLFHPMVAQYFTRLRDIDNLHERLEWHAEEKELLEEEHERRLRVNKELTEDDRKWLADYPNTEEFLVKQLEEAEEEAKKLKERCLELKLVDEDGKAADFESQERQTLIDDLETGSETSEFVKFPVLLPPPGGKRVPSKGPNFKSEETPFDTSDRINQWLLQQLRSSALDVRLLAMTYETNFGPITSQRKKRWQLDVLALWYTDGSRIEVPQKPPSTGLAIQAPPRSGASATILSGETGDRSWAVFLKSSEIRPKRSAPPRPSSSPNLLTLRAK